LREHLDACAACRALVRDLAELDEAPLEPAQREKIWGMIRSGIAAEESAKAAPRAPWWRSIFPPVAIVAATLVLVLIGGRMMRNPQRPPSPVSQSRPPEAVAPPTPSVLRADKPPIMLPASALLVWRGETGAAQDPGKELRAALVPYEADQYAEAAQRLEGLAKKYPRMGEARFYLGVCQLFLDRPADAATSLKTAHTLASPALRDHAAWYLAVAYHRSGHDSDARPLLEQLCQSTGTNSVKACTALKELQVVQ
jgi:TolA-binding protein